MVIVALVIINVFCVLVTCDPYLKWVVSSRNSMMKILPDWLHRRRSDEDKVREIKLTKTVLRIILFPCLNLFWIIVILIPSFKVK